MKKKTTKKSNGFIGKICMVRTYSAGVFYGILSSLKDKTGIVKNARRVWYWDGAATLSQLATLGTSKPDKCKFPCSVDAVVLTEIIEVIPMTNFAIASLNGVPVWKQ